MRRGTSSIIVWLGIVVVLGGAEAHSAPANLGDLVRNSPFSGPTAATAGSVADASLEFRGVLVDGGEFFFSLYDPATRFSLWVGLNEPGNLFTVHSYDSAKGVAAVEYKGRTLNLTLKPAKVIALAPSAPGAPPAPGGVPPNATAAAATDDASRLAAVAEEIRRRRALRAQQAVQTPPSAPTAPTNRK